MSNNRNQPDESTVLLTIAGGTFALLAFGVLLGMMAWPL